MYAINQYGSNLCFKRVWCECQNETQCILFMLYFHTTLLHSIQLTAFFRRQNFFIAKNTSNSQLCPIVVLQSSNHTAIPKGWHAPTRITFCFAFFPFFFSFSFFPPRTYAAGCRVAKCFEGTDGEREGNPTPWRSGIKGVPRREWRMLQRCCWPGICFQACSQQRQGMRVWKQPWTMDMKMPKNITVLKRSSQCESTKLDRMEIYSSREFVTNQKYYSSFLLGFYSFEVYKGMY